MLTAVFFSYSFVGHNVLLGLALIAVAGIGGSIGSGADQAMIADLLPPERHEAGYASTRVAANLGVALGPAIGGLLLIGGHWPVLFAGVTVMGAVAIALAYRYLPHRGAYAPTEPPTRGSFPVIRRDTVFLVFLLSSALAYFVYIAYETVLPVSAVKVHGLSPSTWGFIVIVNPVLVTLFQLRITRWASGYQRGVKFVTAMLMMGGSFLLLLLNASIWMFAGRDGRSSWSARCSGFRPRRRSPRSSRRRTSAAPTWARSTPPAVVGFALGPFIGLQLLDITEPDTSDGSAWFFFAGDLRCGRDRRRGRGARRVARADARRVRDAREAPRRDPRPGGTIEFRVWAPGACECRGARSAARRTTWRATGTTFAGTLRAAPGRRLRVRPRRLGRSCPTRARASSPRASAGLRASSRSRPPPGAGSRSTSSSIYELHVGAFSEEGTFDGVDPASRGAARARRDGDRADAGRHVPGGARLGLRRRLPVRAAPRLRRARTGLSRLVDAAHREGLGVIMDVVHNHIGPGTEAVTAFGPYLTDRFETFWGAGVDFSHAGVREWAIQSALQWVDDYGIDGLRLDAIHAIRDDSARHVLAELAERVHARAPRALVISETSADDDRPIAEWGHDARWADGLHHALHALLTGEREGYYGLYGSVADVARELERRPPERHVVCAQNHDQIGNRALGDRLPPELLRVASSVVLFSAQTPLLFMGEEYGEPSPFQFFCDHIDPAIAEATRQGRKREFARYSAFAGRRPRPAGSGDVPALEALPPRDAGDARPLPQAARAAA